MGLFKPSPGTVSNKFVARLQALTWILIYGGLLALVLGLFVEPIDDDTGWTLVVGGGLTAVAGVALIYVRSRIKDDS
jgi:formate hydrogenlyase subunit 3/multisubunit Na+/H+ antiporter MnhD subunit